MRGLPLLLSAALVLLPGSSAVGYQWYHVPIDSVDHPTYEIQFGDAPAYVGAKVGVFRGYGDVWEAMGLDYPGLGAYSILYLHGQGWVKHVINESLLPGATGVGLGDLDDSGYPDVVVGALPPGDRLVWLENPLPPPVPLYWTRHTVDSLEAHGAREVSIEDIDGDGDLDIAAALRDENKIVWYESLPDTFRMWWSRHEVGDMSGPRGVFVADIDDDQEMDIVAGGMGDSTVAWFEPPELPGDTWIRHVVDDSLHTVKGVFAIDIDGDTDLDIVAAGREAGDVVWYEHADPSDPVAWVKHFIDDDLAGAVSVWCGDLVGDEAPEVAATAKYAACVVVYESDDPAGVGTWTPTVIDDNLPEACPISAGDFDGDGLTDICAAGRDAGVVAWYKTPSGPSRIWQKYVVDAAAGHSMGIMAGDVDNDGDSDIVATARDEGLVTWYENDLRDVYCAFSDGTGGCESDGIYRWHDIPQAWVVSWWCMRPFFVVEHLLVRGVFYCGNNEGLFTSDDLVHWSELGDGILPDGVRCIWFHPSDSNIFNVGTNRGMYRTADFGMQWDPIAEIPSTLPVTDIETAEVPAGRQGAVVFASVGDGSDSDGVFRSDDLGETWQRVNYIFRPTDLLQDYTGGGWGVFMFVGTMEEGIYRMRLDGTVFGDLNTGLPNLTIHRMRYDPFIDTPAIYGSTQNGLYLCMLLELTSVSGEPATSRRACQVWPNPWREGVAFSLTGLDKDESVRLRVFNPLGREIWSSGSLPSRGGTWSVYWNGCDARGQALPPGIYFYRAEARERVYTGKVVRVR